MQSVARYPTPNNPFWHESCEEQTYTLDNCIYHHRFIYIMMARILDDIRRLKDIFMINLKGVLLYMIASFVLLIQV